VDVRGCRTRGFKAQVFGLIDIADDAQHELKRGQTRLGDKGFTLSRGLIA